MISSLVRLTQPSTSVWAAAISRVSCNSRRFFNWTPLRSRLLSSSTNPPSASSTASRSQVGARARDSVAGKTSGNATAPSAQTQARRFTVDWRYYAARFKEEPASHLTAFLVLHEFTAIAPLGLVYYGLSWSDIQIPFPQSVLDESNAKIKRVIKYYGWDIEPDSRVMVNMVAAYGIVKMMLPLRIGVSVFFTPSLAKVLDRIVLPLRNRARAMFGRM